MFDKTLKEKIKADSPKVKVDSPDNNSLTQKMGAVFLAGAIALYSCMPVKAKLQHQN